MSVALIEGEVVRNGVLFYELSVDGQQQRLRRRFQSFCDLHKALCKKFSESALPKLPPRIFSPFGPSADFLAGRRAGLAAYLSALAASEPLRTCPDVIAFLSPNDEDTAFAAAASSVASIGRWEPAEPLPAKTPPCRGPAPKLETSFGEADTVAEELDTALASLRRVRERLCCAQSAEQALGVLDATRERRARALRALERDAEAMAEARALIVSCEKESEDEDFVEKDAARWVRQCEAVAQHGIAFAKALDAVEERALAELTAADAPGASVAAGGRPPVGTPSYNTAWYREQVERLVAESLSDDAAVRSQAVKSLRAMREAIAEDAAKCEAAGQKANAEQLRAAASAASEAIAACKRGIATSAPDERVHALERRMYELIAAAEVPSAPAANTHDKLVSLMRDMQRTRTEIEKLALSDAEASRALASIDELQENLAEFEASWSKAHGVSAASGVLETGFREHVVETARKHHEQAQDDMFQL